MRQVLRLTVLAAAMLPALWPTAGSAGQDPPSPSASVKQRKNGRYVVLMAEDPVITYRGGLSGRPATRPARGQKIDPTDPKVSRYAAFLDERHDAALAQAGGGRKIYDYRYAVNGFAAELTAAAAAKLATVPGVVSVTPDRVGRIATVSTPQFLGLSAPGGLWEQLGGVEAAGEDIIIGVVDSGIWPEHPSVSDRTRSHANDVSGKLSYHQIPGWHGKCVPGEEFNASHCNQKLIGCQFFVEGAGADNLDPTEYLSCRDSHSHGTHVATTAAGNAGVPASRDGFALGVASGIAPRARIAVYKVVWRRPGGIVEISQADDAAAIDQAVHDGVDVISHSLGMMGVEHMLGIVQLAFLHAADAGVFIASVAGNAGAALPGEIFVPAPWLTTVAAGTHGRSYRGSATLGDGTSYVGASVTAGTGAQPRPLVHSSAVGLAGKDPTEVALCFAGTLDAAKVAGKIVLCDRGVNSRLEKSLVVKNAGGAGMILRNVTASTLDADFHSLPSLHVDHIVGAAIKSYIDAAGPGAAARIADGGLIVGTAAPFVANFSSRGPSPAASGDILAPDLTAPGADVLAGIPAAANGGRLFGLMSGTSMATPHVAGLAALLRQAHPDWSPMAIKSALMTTATPTLSTGASGTPYAQGAGHVAPNQAVDPGLVYDADFDDWMGFLCGTGELANPACPAMAIDPSDLNLASIAIGDLAGQQKVTRRVTNVGPPGTYTASVVPPAGVTVSVTPSTLELDTGDAASYELTFTRTTLDYHSSGFGSITWSDGTRAVKSPIVIRPVALSAPRHVALGGASGSTSYRVKFGYTGAFGASAHGLVPAVATGGTVADDPTDTFDTANPGTNQGVTVHTLSVPAGTVLARISLFDGLTDGDDDIDVFVYGPAGNLAGMSTSPTSAEEVNLDDPAAGTYTIYIHGWETDGPDASYTLFTWTVAQSGGDLTVSVPGAATTATSGSVNLHWNGLRPATRYLGTVRYFDGTTERARTSVGVIVP